jgi:hypothetical protein
LKWTWRPSASKHSATAAADAAFGAYKHLSLLLNVCDLPSFACLPGGHEKQSASKQSATAAAAFDACKQFLLLLNVCNLQSAACLSGRHDEQALQSRMLLMLHVQDPTAAAFAFQFAMHAFAGRHDEQALQSS